MPYSPWKKGSHSIFCGHSCDHGGIFVSTAVFAGVLGGMCIYFFLLPFFFSFLELKKVLWGNLDSLDQALLIEAR